LTTFGVEEEFLLVDPDTGVTVPAAPEVLKAAGAAPPTVHAELLRSQVEAATAPCTTIAELAGELAGGRAHLTNAASDCGVWLVPSGTAVLGGDPVVSDGARFGAIADNYAEVARDYQVCGCHVHVGVPDKETAVAVVNHVRPWLPALLALSVNSPFHDGRDTGYASWRMLAQARFPGSGVPPRFRDAADHAEQVARLVECGVLADEAMSFWLVRPSPTWPTVEFRVADTAIDVPAALLQAALSRALVDTALADLARGRVAPEVDDQVMAAAVWTAARHGLGTAVHPFRACRVPAVDLLNELVVLVAPALAAAGDLRTVRDLFRALLESGTGAERQRSIADPRAVVRHLAMGETDAD
jgi:glutamate---cysteine ligase / carboxylate-amine ligase